MGVEELGAHGYRWQGPALGGTGSDVLHYTHSRTHLETLQATQLDSESGRTG